MGRTKRKRHKKKKNVELEDQFKIINLQKLLRLKCPKLKISYFDDTGRGIMCKGKIEKGSILLALPIRHLITPKVNCELFTLIDVDRKPSQLVLSVWLVYEDHLNEQSGYFEYLKSLLRYYTNLYFCTDNEINLLPRFIKEKHTEQKTGLERFFNDFHNLLNDKKCPHCGGSLKHLYTIEKFIWAWFTVNTRSVYYKDESNSASLALAPFLDLFNHSNNAETEMSIDHENGLYILRTLVTYKKYDQVFIKYGSHSNLKLLFEYGFIVPDNIDDFVEFSFQEVVDSVRLINFKFGNITKLKYNFITGNKLNENLTKNKDEFSWNFKGLVYILITEDQNLSVLQSKTYSNEFSTGERETMSQIEKIVTERKLDEFKNDLLRMDMIQECTESFLLAKNLIKMYIKILE